jgi:hypothetical protein
MVAAPSRSRAVFSIYSVSKSIASHTASPQVEQRSVPFGGWHFLLRKDANYIYKILWLVFIPEIIVGFYTGRRQLVMVANRK